MALRPKIINPVEQRVPTLLAGYPPGYRLPHDSNQRREDTPLHPNRTRLPGHTRLIASPSAASVSGH